MSFLSWLRNGASIRSPRARAHRRPVARRFRPQLEALEDRWMPSILTVTTAADCAYPTIPGSLRADIDAAQNGDTILFDPSLKGQAIHLQPGSFIGVSQVINIYNKNLTIQGLGASNLAISADNASRVFVVEYGAQVTITGLAIENGNGSVGTFEGAGDDGLGGAILNYGTLTLNTCTVTGNYCFGHQQYDRGEGIYNASFATMTLNNCTVTNNGLRSVEGAQGGGIFNAGTLTLNGCSVTGNNGGHASLQGGGIFNAGTLTILSSTVTGNSATGGAGIYNDVAGNLTIANKSLVCNNFDSSGAEDDLFNLGAVNISHSKVCVILPHK
jgi:hypothetical protein